MAIISHDVEIDAIKKLIVALALIPLRRAASLNFCEHQTSGNRETKRLAVLVFSAYDKVTTPSPPTDLSDTSLQAHITPLIMSNVTCYGFKCSTVSTWESSLRTCCQSPNGTGRSVDEFGEYFCAGNILGPTVTCFNQTFQAQKAQFDVYTLDCFDDVGDVVDAGVVSTSNSTAFACSKDFLSNCYDANGNKTEDPRNGTGCGSGSAGSSSGGSSSGASGTSILPSLKLRALLIMTLLTSSWVMMGQGV